LQFSPHRYERLERNRLLGTPYATVEELLGLDFPAILNRTRNDWYTAVSHLLEIGKIFGFEALQLF
jgi:hypothetical protein